MRTQDRWTRLFALGASLALVTACGTLKTQSDAGTHSAMDTLVTAQWLSQHLGEPDLVVLDCTVHIEPDKDRGYRLVSGRADYGTGHIPTAGFADLTADLSAGDGPFKFALPTPQKFADAMAALGVGDGLRVVLYSANNPAWAARVWWMLRWVGFDRAALLDGGLKAWTAGGRPLSTQPADRPAKKLSIALRPKLIADRDEVRAAIGNPTVTIIDALPEASFRGKMSMYARPGHIPGATNIPASTLTDESGRYLPLEKLVVMHAGDRTGRAITYCGGGISASANAFIMTRVGFTNVAVYMGSLQEWATDPANPMEVDPHE
jgi:thiosulfate/3-mercaptopyruvate sulfurtransferase